MGLFGLCLLAVVASHAHGQTICVPDTVTLYDSIKTEIVRTAALYFNSLTSDTDSGFGDIDASLAWTPIDLFEQFFGETTSTAAFIAAMLDFNKMTGHSDASTLKIAQLVSLGEYQDARAAFAAMALNELARQGHVDSETRAVCVGSSEAVRSWLQNDLASLTGVLSSDLLGSFLNLKVGSSLSFVMDTSGSMGSEIENAKAQVINIITNTAGTRNAPLRYVLAPYSDPEIGPVTVTGNPEEFIAAVDVLSASGGGDFPELALGGMLLALQNMGFRSVMYVITDATAKDFHLQGQVLALCLIKKVSVTFFLTSNLSRKKRSLLENRALYDSLAERTLGNVLVVSKGDFDVATELMAETTKQGVVTLVSRSSVSDDRVFVSLDSDVRSMTVLLTGDHLYDRVEDLSGASPAMEVLADITGMKLVRYTDLTAGRYIFNFHAGHGNFSITVRGESTIGFHAQLRQRKRGTDEIVSSRQLIAHSETFADFTLYGDITGLTINEFVLISRRGEHLYVGDLSPCDDGAECRTLFSADSFDLPNEPMLVMLQGQDRDGNPFQRIDPCAITPFDTNSYLSDVADVTVEAGATMTLAVTFHNRKMTENFYFAVADNQDFLTIDVSEIEVANATDHVLTLTVQVPAGSEPGSLSKVVVTANGETSGDLVFTQFVVTVLDEVVRCLPAEVPRGGSMTCTDVTAIGSMCSLTCLPEYVQEGPEHITCQANGTWSEESPGSCTYIGSQTCQVAGDPHYTTFDGSRYDFMGACLYTVVKTIKDDVLPSVEISAENMVFRGSTASVIKQAFVTVYNTTIHFKSRKIILIDGLKVNIPSSLFGGKITLKFEGGDVVLRTDFKLIVYYDGSYNFRVTLPGNYMSNVKGLCGDYDGDNSNEMINNGSTYASAADFGNAQEIAGGSAEGCRKGVPSDEDEPCESLAERAKYAEKCAYLKQDCFEHCGTNETKQIAFEDCVYDMCGSGGAESVLEESIKTFAYRCNINSIETCDWREELELPMVCPTNSVYNHLANPCPNTCVERRGSLRCIHMPMTEACVCKSGFFQSGKECVPVSDCGCASQGKYYLQGQGFIKPGCGEECICRNGEVQCTAYSCIEGTECRLSPAAGKWGCQPSVVNECHATGDPHYQTLDGSLYDFQGKCCYVMLNATGPHLPADRQILVLAQNENRHGNTRVSYVQLVNILIGEYQFTLGPGKHAQVKHMNQTTIVTTQAYQSPDEMYSLSIVGGYATFSTNYGIGVRFAGSNLFIAVPSFFMNKVSGMCGNYTGSTADDFGGNTISEFAARHLFPTECAEDPTIEPFVCSSEDHATFGGVEFCGQLGDPEGSFAPCHGDVEVGPYLERCIFDVCANDGDMEVLAEALDAYVQVCKFEDVRVCNWRNQPELIPECPENSTFAECESPCTDTCQDLEAEASCELPDLVDKCVCQLGFVMSNNMCVERSQCGCTIDGEYVEQGTEFMEANCTSKRSCDGPNFVSTTSDPCKETETCRLLPNGEHQCIANEKPYALLFGSNHYKTFDDSFSTLPGDCAYLFVGYHAVDREEMDDVPSFRVIVTNRPKKMDGASRVKEVIIEITKESEDIIIKLTEGKVVKINHRAVAIGTRMHGLHIVANGANVGLQLPFGIEVYYNGMDWLRVDVDQKFTKLLYGMAGNYNGDPHDDMRIDDMMFTPEMWPGMWVIDSYSTDTCIATPDPEDPCERTGLRDRFARDCDCGLITDTTGPFAICHDKMDPEPFLNACVRDACADDGSVQSIARAITAYSMACRGKGIRIEDWKEILHIPKQQCPDNSHYDECGSAPQPTCGSAGDEMFAAVCVPGCVCDDGFIMSNGMCVEDHRCGCFDDGYYYEHGKCVSKRDCEEKCTCINGEWNCEASHCYDGQYCGLRDGEVGCYWHDECKYDNGGCSDKCSWMNGTVVCSCSMGMVLIKDGKTCIEVASVYFSEDDGSCGPVFSMWRTEFLAWKNEYLPEWIEELNNYKMIVAGEMAATCDSSFDVYWTQWFDRDDPGGCGDEETLEFIRLDYPGLCCKKPLAAEARLVGGRRLGATDEIYEVNETMGFLCKNADQDGVLCSDYEVRFLCPQMRNTTMEWAAP